jgi:hypothetical protein
MSPKCALFLVTVMLASCDHPDLTPVEQDPHRKPVRPEQTAAPAPHYYVVHGNETERNLERIEDPDVAPATFRSTATCDEGDILTGGGCYVAMANAPFLVSARFPLMAVVPRGRTYECVAENPEFFNMIVNARAICLDVDGSRADIDTDE